MQLCAINKYARKHRRINASGIATTMTGPDCAFMCNLISNRVAKEMRTDFEMGTDGRRFLCFQFGIS